MFPQNSNKPWKLSMRSSFFDQVQTATAIGTVTSHHELDRVELPKPSSGPYVNHGLLYENIDKIYPDGSS